MAYPVYVVDIAFRQFLYYWQCGLQPSLYLDTNSDRTVFACSKVTGGQAYSETQVSRKPGHRSRRSSRRWRRKRNADRRDQTIQNATSTESFHENTFPHGYSGEEGSKELVTDDSQTFTSSDSQNFQPTFRNTIDDDRKGGSFDIIQNLLWRKIWLNLKIILMIIASKGDRFPDYL